MEDIERNGLLRAFSLNLRYLSHSLVSLPLLDCSCRQNGLWWVWVCQRRYGCCGFGFADMDVGVMGCGFCGGGSSMGLTRIVVGGGSQVWVR